MRFMIQVRANAVSERGDPPGPEYAKLFEEMGAFHEEMARRCAAGRRRPAPQPQWLAGAL